MEIVKSDLVIIGSGPAGLSAATSASERGVGDITLVERLETPGGMLRQCFHRGFGQAEYGRELTGPEYLERMLPRLGGTRLLTGCLAARLGRDRRVTVIDGDGARKIEARAVIVATGCRERAIGSLPVYGSRPAGVFTAGSVQKMINLGGFGVGHSAVVLGSGDVGMIVAHHLTQAGTRVLAVIEKENAIGGLARNRRRYLEPHGIPVLTGRTVTRLHGSPRLQAVSVCEMGENGEPAPETERRIDCDTLISSVGLVPELELLEDMGLDFKRPASIEQTSAGLPWLFVCGNANRVHSLVDSVVSQSRLAGIEAAEHIIAG